MYQTLIPKIKSTLEAVTKVNKVYMHPTNNIDSYPCAIVMPIAFTNEYHSNQENLKGYTFRIYLILETTQSTRETAYETIMPELVDAVLAKFDDDWGFLSLAGAHRIWQKIGTGAWYTDEIAEGEVLVAELDLVINTLTNN